MQIMNEIFNGSGQGLRRFYLNENFQRVWIDMPSDEWQKQALIDNKNQNETNQQSPKGNNL